jgi:hypothetical protein
LTVVLFALSLLIAAIYLTRWLLEWELKIPSKSQAHKSGGNIRPVELCFLANNGDLSDVLAVLAVDLLQRAVKSKLNAANNPELLDYEQKLWLVTTKYVSDSANDIIESVSPEKIMTDPLGYWRRMSVLYRTILKLFKSFLHEVVSDPRRLKRYFSISWIARLVLDFSSAGYRDRLRENLAQHLTEKGMLVERDKRINRSRVFVLAGSAFAVISILVVLNKLTLLATTIIVLTAVMTACLIKGLIYLTGFLPLYTELSLLLDHVSRRDWRIRVLRLALNLVRVVWMACIIFVFVSGSFTGWILSAIAIGQIQVDKLYIELLLVIAEYLTINFILRGVQLQNMDIATLTGEAQLLSARRKLSTVGPFQAFKDALGDANYDPAFSEIVALYGIEPLIFLA